nr:PREDICTED: uncharacterized protein LOC108226200 [Daucus carota subsp. sativus]
MLSLIYRPSHSNLDRLIYLEYNTMASYAIALSLLLATVLLATLKVEAREMQYFSHFNIPQDEQSALKPVPEINNYNRRNFENHEIDIPTEEFIANIQKDSAESNSFPHGFDKNSYITAPQGVHASENKEFELTAEEQKFFNEKDRMNGYTNMKVRENVNAKEAQGMSDTRTLENGKYYYNPMSDIRASGKYNSAYKSKYDEFRHLEDFEFNPQNPEGYFP